jgi:hypothetical protein
MRRRTACAASREAHEPVNSNHSCRVSNSYGLRRQGQRNHGDHRQRGAVGDCLLTGKRVFDGKTAIDIAWQGTL